MTTLDATDYKILNALWNDGRLSITDLSEQINLSHTPTLKRVNRLRNEEYISGFRAVLNETKLGGSLTVFTSVTLSTQSRGDLSEFEEIIQNSPEVIDCFLMTGEADYLLRVTVDTLDQFEGFLADKLSRLDCVQGIKSSIALRPVVLGRMPPKVQAALNVE